MPGEENAIGGVRTCNNRGYSNIEKVKKVKR